MKLRLMRLYRRSCRDRLPESRCPFEWIETANHKKVSVADFEGVTSNVTFVLETKDESILPQRLLPFLLLSDRFTSYSIGKSKGSTNPYVLFSDLADFELDLPEPKAVAEIADIMCAAERLKEDYRSLIATCDDVVKSQFGCRGCAA